MKLIKQLLEMKSSDELLVYTPNADMKVPRFFIGNVENLKHHVINQMLDELQISRVHEAARGKTLDLHSLHADPESLSGQKPQLTVDEMRDALFGLGGHDFFNYLEECQYDNAFDGDYYIPQVKRV